MTDYQQPDYTPRTFDEEGVKRENALQEHIIDRLVLEQGYLRRTGSARSNNNFPRRHTGTGGNQRVRCKALYRRREEGTFRDRQGV